MLNYMIYINETCKRYTTSWNVMIIQRNKSRARKKKHPVFYIICSIT